jgi:hypothetical protein
MNKTLTALMTKLNWQQNDLNLHLKAAEHESHLLIQDIQALEASMHPSCPTSLRINPEVEMSKLNFLTQQHAKKEELSILLKEKQTIEMKLKDKLQRIKTELKMLEKYSEREQLSQKEQQLKTQQNTLDEWVLQRGTV